MTNPEKMGKYKLGACFRFSLHFFFQANVQIVHFPVRFCSLFEDPV